MNDRMVRRCGALFLAAVAVVLLSTSLPVHGQQQGLVHPDAYKGRPTMAVDLTGTWSSIITEQWRFRMMTPRKGDFSGVLPLNQEGLRIGNMWNPAADQAANEQCKGYGAVGVMQLPGHVRVSWQDEMTLMMELEAGNQTRLLHFGQAKAPSGNLGYQGYSAAQWEYAVTAPDEGRMGDLKVVTTHMRPGYSRKNGAPVSPDAELTEYFHRTRAPNGDDWLTLMAILNDSTYYYRPHIVSWHFKKAADDVRWKPRPCTVD